MNISDYAAWANGIRRAPRGSQRWSSRTRIYEAVRAEPVLVTDSVSEFCSKTATKPSTFYAYFGKDSRGGRWAEHDDSADIASIALVETKAWSMYPYLRGAIEESQRLQSTPLSTVESLVRAAAEWAAEEPELALVQQGRTLDPLVGTLQESSELAEQEASVDLWAEIADRAVRYAAETPDESSLSALNMVRHQLPDQLHGVREGSGDTSAVQAITAVALFVEQFLEGGSIDPSDSQLATVLAQALSTIQGRE